MEELYGTQYKSGSFFLIMWGVFLLPACFFFFFSFNYSAVKGTSGMGKFGSVIDRMNMKLGSKFIYSLNIKTQLLKRLQRVIVVDGATHFQKDGVERQ